MLVFEFMKSIKEIRLNNLKKLIEAAGGRQAFCDLLMAQRLDLKYGYIGLLLCGKSKIGDSTALKLEQIGGKPKYWLDQDWDGIDNTEAESSPRETLNKMMEAAETAIIRFSHENEIEFTDDQIYQLLLEVLDFAGRRHFSTEFVEHYVIEVAKKLKA